MATPTPKAAQWPVEPAMICEELLLPAFYKTSYRERELNEAIVVVRQNGMALKDYSQWNDDCSLVLAALWNTGMALTVRL